MGVFTIMETLARFSFASSTVIRSLGRRRGLQRWWCFLVGCCLILSIAGGTDHHQGIISENVDYFDLLLQQQQSTAVEFSQSQPDSKVAKIQITADNSDNTTTYRLAHMVSFLPFSNQSHIRSGMHNHAAGALLAIHHFNHKKTSPILQDFGEIENCNVRLTTELIDSEFDPVSSTSVFLKDISVRQRGLEETSTSPVAILGAYRSAVTSPLAILSGVNEMLQMTPFSTSTELSNKQQYPYLSRTCPSAQGEAQVAVDYFLFLGRRWAKPVRYVAVLYVSDTFGLAVHKAFSDFATNANMLTTSFSFGFSASPNDIGKAVKALQQSQFRYFYVICFQNHYPVIMQKAHEEGIAGDDYLWLFHGPATASFQQSVKYPHGSALYNATKGIGILTYGVKEHEKARFPPEDGEAEELPDVPVSARDKIKVSWRNAIRDPLFTNYVRSKLPKTLANVNGYDADAPFELDISMGPSYLYDTVTAMGIAMCRAEPEFFVASDVAPNMQSISFDGATGAVAFDEKGTRDFRTVQFTVWNVLPREEVDLDGRNSFSLTPSYSYEGGSWKSVGDNTFIYADGTAIPPDVLAPIDPEQERVSTGGFVAGISILGFALVSSLFCLGWTILRRKTSVVCASQMPFLVLISLGSLVSSLAIVPLAIQESSSSGTVLNAACMITPWLYTSSIAVTLSALSLKVWRLYEIYRDAELDRLYLSSRDFLVWVCGFFAINSLLMTLWTTQSPWQWTRLLGETTDVFGRSSSYYSCENNDGSELYAVFLIIFYGAVLVLALLGSYITRELETEYRESQYVGYALLSQLETLAVAFPFVALLDSDPGARFFLQVGLVFLTSFLPLSLIFFPKMQALKQQKEHERTSLDRRGLFSTHQRRTRDGEFDPNSRSSDEKTPPGRFPQQQQQGDDPDKVLATGGLTPEGFVAIDRMDAAAAAVAAMGIGASSSGLSSSDAEQKEVTEGSHTDNAIPVIEEGLRVTHHPKAEQHVHASQYSLGTRPSQQGADRSGPAAPPHRRGSYLKDDRW